MHSLFKIFLIFWFIRLSMAVGMYIYELTGSLTPPLSEFFWTQLWQSGETMVMLVLFVILIKIKPLKLPAHMLLYMICVLLVFWAIADPIVFSMAGDHITPSLLSHFAGPKIFLTDDLWLPIKKHWILVVSGLSAVFALLFALYRLFKKSYNESTAALNSKPVIVIGTVGIMLMSLPKVFGMTYLSYPAEILYMRDYYGWNRYFPEKEDIERLRHTFNSSIEKEWVSEQYPLLHTNKKNSINSTQPDIILFVIESLRAKSVKTFSPTTSYLTLPTLDRIAQNGVKFPFFISNGFPSTEGFFSLMSGTWPHSRVRIALDFQGVEFDNVATHLNNVGYKTIRVDFDASAYNESYWIKKYYSQAISFINKGIFASEKNTINETMKLIQEHDSLSSKPFFLHFKTVSPHYPYEFPVDSTETYEEIGAPSENYKVGMEYIDEHLGRFYDFLQSRDRKDSTVIIVVGDHANYLDKSTATALPIDDVLWTGAIIAGNENLVGKTRVDNSHSSQIDILPTILDLAGDNAPRVSIGRSLLDPDFDKNETAAFAIRPSGVRIDKGGYTYIVDRRHPSQFIKFQAFEGLMPRKGSGEPELSPQDYLKFADTWSYLIEQNKVWKPNENDLME